MKKQNITTEYLWLRGLQDNRYGDLASISSYCNKSLLLRKTSSKNWFKKAYLQKEAEWQWSRFFRYFGGTVLLGAAALAGMSLTQLQKLYAENPNQAVAIVHEYQKQQPSNTMEGKTYSPAPNANVQPSAQQNPQPQPPPVQQNTQPQQPQASPSINLTKIYEIESSSGKNPSIKKPNKAGALGHFQFLKETWDECVSLMGKKWSWKKGALDFNKSKQVANFYFNKRIPDLLKSFQIPDTIETRLAAYNWGIGSLNQAYKKHGDNWINHTNQETSQYIKLYLGK